MAGLISLISIKKIMKINGNEMTFEINEHYTMKIAFKTKNKKKVSFL